MNLGLIITLISMILAIFGIYLGLKSRKDKGLLPQIHIWDRDRIPITIVIDEYLKKEFPDIEKYVEFAVNFWDKAVPGLFVPLGDVGEGVIIPIMPASSVEYESGSDHNDALAYNRLTITKEGRIKSAAVYVFHEELKRLIRLGDNNQVNFSLAHELGHVLGLDHDDFSTSVMFPNSVSHNFYEVTSADRFLLERIYHRKTVS